MFKSLAIHTQRLRAAYVCSSCLGRTLAGREAQSAWLTKRPTFGNQGQVRCRVGKLTRLREKGLVWNRKFDCLTLHEDLVRNFKKVAMWQRTKAPIVDNHNYRLLKLLTDRMIKHIPPHHNLDWRQLDQESWTTYSLNNGTCVMPWHNEIDFHRNPREYHRLYQGFCKTIFERILEPKKRVSEGGHHFKAPNMNAFKDAYISLGIDGIDGMLKAYFRVFKLDNRIQPKIETNLKPSTFYDQFRYPVEWYPDARKMQRTWHLHIGPTNSGKTYNALKRLQESQDGIYAGPLRLLAHEVYSRFNAKGVPCNLVTGEEIREASEHCKLSACTVEMTPLNMDMEVCVLDEIQMLNDPDRGRSWTNCLLGVRAKEIHLCGEVRTMQIIKKLAKLTGEKLIVHQYKRLGPLKVEPNPIKGWGELQPGDAVIGFSRNQLFSLKNQIEKITNYKCAIVYGNLPAEVRAEQARLFNDPKSGYDILIASDAIGMGLNLSVRRIVFSMMAKFDGFAVRNLTTPQTLQIAGRAGRYKTASDDEKATAEKAIPPPPRKPEDPPLAENTATEGIKPHGPLPGSGTVGYVTSHSEGKCHKYLRTTMESVAEPITKAILEPTGMAVLNFAAICPDNLPFSSVILALQQTTEVGSEFEFGKSRDVLETAEIFDEVKGLTAHERYVLMLSPVRTRSVRVVAAALGFGRAIADRRLVSIEDIKEVDLEALDDSAAGTVSITDQLRRLEELHQVFILYMWLYYRFQHIFGSPNTVLELKATCEALIQDLLVSEERFSNEGQVKTLAERREKLWGPTRNPQPIRAKSVGPVKPDHLNAQRGVASRIVSEDFSELGAEYTADVLKVEVADLHDRLKGLMEKKKTAEGLPPLPESPDVVSSLAYRPGRRFATSSSTDPLGLIFFGDENDKPASMIYNKVDASSANAVGFRFNPTTFEKRVVHSGERPLSGLGRVGKEGKKKEAAAEGERLRPIARNVGMPSSSDELSVAHGGVGLWRENQLGTPESKRITDEKFARANRDAIVDKIASPAPSTADKATPTADKAQDNVPLENIEDDDDEDVFKDAIESVRR